MQQIKPINYGIFNILLYFCCMKRIRWKITLCLWMTLTTAGAQTLTKTDLHAGDLLFVCNNKGNAITEVTQGIGGRGIDHVAMLIPRDSTGALMVLEATPQRGVDTTAVDSFLHENSEADGRMSVVAGRLDVPFDTLNTIRRGLSFMGLPYDSLFEADDREIYCSELVQKSYVDKEEQAIFETIPMSFHNTEGKIIPYWVDFYKRHGRDVPEGAPGTNPGQLSRNKHVKIIGTLFR